MENNPSYKQRIASNPKTSVWVSASAGTGKTKILVDRLLRLLLDNVSIDNILCITYSKAAAQEMINRLMGILSEWSIISENDLINHIKNISGIEPTKEQITIAKELFSKIINHPRELKIQTIHSFCQNLLARFPIEANIPTNFLVIQDDVVQNIKNQAIETVLSKEMDVSKSSKETENILEKLTKNISQYSFENIIKNILNYSEKLELISTKYNVDYSLENLREEIYGYLQADISLSSSDVYFQYFNNSYNINKIAECVRLLKEKELAPKKFDVIQIDDFIKLPIHQKVEQFNNWKEFFLTKTTGTPKASILNKDVLKTLNSDADFVINGINEAALEIINVIEKYKNQICAELNFSLIKIALSIYKQYQELKYSNGYLDFSDLIMKTYELLTNPSLSLWIMYKIDQKIDHILVDEAQDTSPMQWEIIKSLTEEFFNGENAKSDIDRSIFVVGDIKQSIYSFQGSDPYSFSKTREFLSNKIQNANKPFVQIAMNTSFRSSQGIIDMVNHVSSNIFDNQKSPYLNEEINHNVFHTNKPFSVEVWPLICIDKDSKNDDAKSDKFQNLAQAIVKKIQYLNKKQGIAFGDILILYRNRKNNITLEYIVKLLKDNKIPALGIDKINLKNNIAVKDLIALAKFLSQTKDTFSLSCVLKSPMFNLLDEDIFKIIHYNTQKNAFLNLSITHPKIYSTLKEWLNMVDFKSIFDLFFHILYKNDNNGETNITKFISRLGLDVIDPLSEFINLIFRFKEKNDDNLQSFIKFLENYDNEISREFSNNKDSVNLMSIHSSKGLQSKVVFLLNDLDKRSPKKDILFNNTINKPLLLILPRTDIKCKSLKNLEETYKLLDYEESKRLLYVAITRAEEHLYVASVSNTEDVREAEKSSHLWWNSITNNVETILAKEEDPFFNKKLGFTSNIVLKLQNIAKTKLQSLEKTKIDIPKWVHSKAPIEPTPSKPLTPSKLIFEETYFSSPLENIKLNKNNTIINKGSIIHKILEQINYINPKEHDLFVDSFISSQNQLFYEDQEDIKQNINNIIKNQEFNFLFDKKTLNEISLSGSVFQNNMLQLVSARVDKLIITEQEVILIDYKYSKKKKSIPVAYQKQINLYKKLLHDIYPQHIIRGFILFSQSADIVEIK